MKTAIEELREKSPQFASDDALLSGRVPGVTLEYIGGSIGMDAFRIYLDGKEVGQARFFDGKRKTLLIRFDLPEVFNECPDWFRGQNEETGENFAAPAWNLWADFLASFKTHPFNS